MGLTTTGLDMYQSGHQKNARQAIKTGVDQRQEMEGLVHRMPLRRLTDRMT